MTEGRDERGSAFRSGADVTTRIAAPTWRPGGVDHLEGERPRDGLQGRAEEELMDTAGRIAECGRQPAGIDRSVEAVNGAIDRLAFGLEWIRAEIRDLRNRDRETLHRLTRGEISSAQAAAQWRVRRKLLRLLKPTERRLARLGRARDRRQRRGARPPAPSRI